MTVLTNKPKVGWTDAALLAQRTHRDLLYSYSLGWRKPKSKGTSLWLTVEMSITIAGVQYLYPRLDYES